MVVRGQDGKRIQEYHTLVGTVREVTGYSEVLDGQGLPGRVEEHLLKGPKDYRVWEWVVERSHYVPTYDAYRAYDAEVDEGCAFVPVPPLGYTMPHNQPLTLREDVAARNGIRR